MQQKTNTQKIKIINKSFFKKTDPGFEDWKDGSVVKALAAFVEDQGSSLSTHLGRLTTASVLPCLTSLGTDTVVDIPTQRHTHVRKVKNKSKGKKG